MGITIVLIGVGTCLFFILGINEPFLTKKCKEKAQTLKQLELAREEKNLSALKTSVMSD